MRECFLKMMRNIPRIAFFSRILRCVVNLNILFESNLSFTFAQGILH